MDILDETTDFIDRQEGKRPAFLTVLCILTWVGCGFSLISGFFQLIAYSAVNSMSNSLQSTASGSNGAGYLFWAAIATLAGSIICSIAAVFMFKQKKFGFFIYIFGQIIPIIVGFYTMLAATNGVAFGAGFSLIMMVAAMIFPIAFIIMYGVNLKHMNK